LHTKFVAILFTTVIEQEVLASISGIHTRMHTHTHTHTRMHTHTHGTMEYYSAQREEFLTHAKWWLTGAEGCRVGSHCLVVEFQCGKIEGALELEGGDGGTKTRMFTMPLKRTLKSR
jgi:hypothetical protein